MKKFLLLVFVLVLSCSQNTVSNYEITFPDNMTFDEFELKLEEYAKIKSFPNINK